MCVVKLDLSVWESSWKWEISRSKELILWVGNNANCHSVMVIEDTNVKLSCQKPVDCILIFSIQKVYKKHRKAVQRLVLNPCGTPEKQVHLGSSTADVGQSLCQTWNLCHALQFTSSMTRMEGTNKLKVWSHWTKRKDAYFKLRKYFQF